MLCGQTLIKNHKTLKRFFLALVLICATFGIYAQGDSKLTFKAGVGLGTVVGDDMDHIKSTFAYKIGAGYEFDLSEKFAVEPSIMLTNKSFKNENIAGTIDRFYLEVPVLFAFKVALNDNLNLVINAGPYVAYGIYGSDIEFYNGYSSNIFDSDDCDRFDYGVELGAKIGYGNIYVGADFSRGLKKYNSDVDAYNQCCGLTFGYKF